ncbi:unnamed protein product, partial [Ectocarpus sp. 6 AP-2014]
MDTTAHRWKRNSRTIDRTSTSGELDAEALRHLTDFQHTIKAWSTEAGHGVTSNAWRKRLESAKSECTACLKTISSKGTRPGVGSTAAMAHLRAPSIIIPGVERFSRLLAGAYRASITFVQRSATKRLVPIDGGGVGTGHDGEDSRDPGGEGASSGSRSQYAGPRGDAERWNSGGGSVAAGADGHQGGDARGLAAAAASPACDTGDAAAAVVGSGGRTKPNCGCMDEIKVHIFSSSFFTKLVEKDIDEFNAAYSGVKRWSRHVDLFSMKFVMVPVVEDEHWILACLCNLDELEEICQKWPVVTAADVNDGMQAHFNPKLFSPLDITEERRMLGKLLQDCKVRYEREQELQISKKRRARDNTHAGSSSGSEVEVEEPPPTMSSGELSDAWCCLWNNKNN